LSRHQAIVETKAKGFQEHISFESTAFKEQISVSLNCLFRLVKQPTIVETKAKGFREHISFESTAFKEHGWDLTKQYISVGETPADSRIYFFQ
jgi:hypothetical protein